MGAKTEIPKKIFFFFLENWKIFSEIIPHSGMSRYLYIQVPYFGSSDVSGQCYCQHGGAAPAAQSWLDPQCLVKSVFAIGEGGLPNGSSPSPVYSTAALGCGKPIGRSSVVPRSPVISCQIVRLARDTLLRGILEHLGSWALSGWFDGCSRGPPLGSGLVGDPRSFIEALMYSYVGIPGLNHPLLLTRGHLSRLGLAIVKIIVLRPVPA